MSTEEKTEQPTSHKLKEARKKGEVVFSRDLTGAVVFAAGLLLLWLTKDFIELQARRVLDGALDIASLTNKASALGPAVEKMLTGAFWIIAPILLVVFVVSVVTGLGQTRGNFSAEPLQLKFERLNPGEALKQLFSTRQLGVLIQMTFKFAFLLGVVFWAVNTYLEPMVSTIYSQAENSKIVSVNAIFALFGSAALVFLALGAIDFFQQHFEFIKRNKMSKTERKRENKDNNGDPHLRAELRSRRRELTDGAPGQDMKKANVVVTNPTHYSVALYYEAGVVDLPIVVAKGMDQLAFQIRTEAVQNFIPVLESPPLARSLYATVDVGSKIGEEHLEPVAEVFRWLAKINRPAEQQISDRVN